MGIPHHPIDARQFRDFFGRSLRITPGNKNLRAGVFPLYAADRTARIVIRILRHRAGIQYYDIGRRSIVRLRQSAFGKLRFQRRSIGLRGATTEILHKETHRYF